MMQQAFFSLVRAGLWDTPADAALFRGLTPAQWQELHRLAHTQSLLAVVFDGLNTLPVDLRPPRPLYLQWAAQTLQIEQANDRLDRMIVRLDRLYTDAGLHPVLLKGQGMAACYRQPRHRQCGDIDVYLGKDGQPRANRLLLEDGAQETGEESDKHASYELDGVHIENHRLVNRTNNPLANRRFVRLVREWYPQGAERRIGMATPPHSKAVSACGRRASHTMKLQLALLLSPPVRICHTSAGGMFTEPISRLAMNNSRMTPVKPIPYLQPLFISVFF